MQTFTDFSLSEPLLKAISALGFEKPSPIQAETLPLLLGNKTDFLGLAATGTGKTAAFAIPLLERVDPKRKDVQALVLCPTRELAVQVAGQINLLGKFKGARALAIYGGTGYGDQIAGLKSGVPIVVGTPGRVVDHLEKGTLRLQGLDTLVLDEADEMISMGFKDDLEFVLSSVPSGQANTWLFSATMSPDVRGVADRYLNEPEKVQINRTEMLPSSVKQIYFNVHEWDKPAAIRKLIDAAEDFYGIIFCQTKSLVMDLHQSLKGHGYAADCLHGDLEQAARDRVMKAFRERKVKVLVATDVACRGLDVNDISHVINYSLPRELDNYVHRIGRTGRVGKTGIAYSLVTPSHRILVRKIEQMTKSRMEEGKLPSIADLIRKKIASSRDSFAAEAPVDSLTKLVEDNWADALTNLSPSQIAARFLAILHPELTQEPPKEEERPKREQEHRGPPRGKFSKFRPGGTGPKPFQGKGFREDRAPRAGRNEGEEFDDAPKSKPGFKPGFNTGYRDGFRGGSKGGHKDGFKAKFKDKFSGEVRGDRAGRVDQADRAERSGPMTRDARNFERGQRKLPPWERKSTPWGGGQSRPKKKPRPSHP